MRTWNDNYGDIITWLTNIHVLTRSPHNYIPGETCLYYTINLNPPPQFTGYLKWEIGY